MYFVILYKHNGSSDVQLTRRVLKEHVQHLKRFHESGQLFMSGLFAGTINGMVILDVVSPEDAAVFMDQDPALTSGVYTATRHEWQIGFKK
ncbi:MAG: hypothetical protein JW902_20220 [Syntrophaceae bacterium]|nr:hypothetical protein [Syntrophaceae bacterium]